MEELSCGRFAYLFQLKVWISVSIPVNSIQPQKKKKKTGSGEILRIAPADGWRQINPTAGK